MITQATDIKHITRNTTYRITEHNVLIKTESGWKEGCIYWDNLNAKTYVRPYEWFTEDKWIILK